VDLARLLVRRILEVVGVLFLVTIASFLLTALQGNPAGLLCGLGGSKQCITHERVFMGLNHPIIVQYFTWLGHFLSGNFGISYVTAGGTPVSTIIKQCYGVTVELVIYSQVMAAIVAVPIAMWAALRPNRIFDKLSTTFSFTSLAAPSFIVGPLLALVFTAEIYAFPGPASQVPSFYSHIGGNLRVMFLPSLTLALGSIAIYQRLLRADMIATLEEDYIVMARAKGLSTKRILIRHALRPSTFSLITVGGVQLGGLITGAIIAEEVFSLHGLGYELVTAVSQSDYATVQMITVIVATSYVILNFLIDFLYAFIDPRIRRARTSG
jgi:peptide/nickel transport system permease protein